MSSAIEFQSSFWNHSFVTQKKIIIHMCHEKMISRLGRLQLCVCGWSIKLLFEWKLWLSKGHHYCKGGENVKFIVVENWFTCTFRWLQSRHWDNRKNGDRRYQCSPLIRSEVPKKHKKSRSRRIIDKSQYIFEFKMCWNILLIFTSNLKIATIWLIQR